MPFTKIRIAGLDFACIEKEQLASVLGEYLEGERMGNERTIYFARFTTLLFSLLLPGLRKKLRKIEIVYPASALLRWACRQLLPTRSAAKFLLVSPFQFIVSILIALNNRHGSLFLLGGSRPCLQRAETAVLKSFPLLRILGRYHGLGKVYPPEQVVLSVRKCAPDILLVGRGRLCRYHYYANANQGLSIYFPPIIKTFARHQGTSGHRVSWRQENFPGCTFLCPWSWLKFPFVVVFILYILILKSRKAHG